MLAWFCGIVFPLLLGTPPVLAEDTFTLTSQESTLRINLAIPSGNTGISPGSNVEVQAQIYSESWEVWTDTNTGDIEQRNVQTQPCPDTLVTFSLDTSTNASLTSDVILTNVDGIATTWVILGPNASGALQIQSQVTVGDASASASTPLSISEQPESAPDEESWTYSHTETVLLTSMALPETIGLQMSPGQMEQVHAQVIVRTWEVWTGSQGSTAIWNYTESPAQNAQLTWSLEDEWSGEASFAGDSITSTSTNTAGESTAIFHMGSQPVTLRLDVSYVGSYTGTATLSIGLPDQPTNEEYGDGGTPTENQNSGSTEQWAYSHTESHVHTHIATADGSDPTAIVPGQPVTLVTTVSYDSWEVWSSDQGGTWFGNPSSGPAAYLPVWLSLDDSNASLSSGYESTDTNGQIFTTITLAAGQPATFQAQHQFQGSPGYGTLYLSPASTTPLTEESSDSGNGNSSSNENGTTDQGDGYTFSEDKSVIDIQVWWDESNQSFQHSIIITTWEVWYHPVHGYQNRNEQTGLGYNAQTSLDVDITSTPGIIMETFTVSYGGQTGSATRSYASDNGTTNNNGSGTTNTNENNGGNGTSDPVMEATIEYEVENPDFVGPPSPEQFEADERGYQRGVEELWERYGSLDDIPSEEIQRLRNQYPLAERSWVPMQNQEKTFKLITKIVSIASRLEGAISGWATGVQRLVSFTVTEVVRSIVE